MIELWAKDLVFIDKSSTIDRVDDSFGKVDRAKLKNTIILDFLVKCKLLVKPSFG